MDYTTFFLLLSFILAIIYLLITHAIQRKSGAWLPPGPYPFPVIGSIFKLGQKPHHSLAKLAKTYGPLMTLKLGTTTKIVASSAKVAKEVLQTHDQIFSSRLVPENAKVLDHHKVSVVWLPAGAQWRMLRRICREQLFSLQQLDASQPLRRKKVQELLDYADQCSINGEAVDIGGAVFTTSVNSLSSLIFSTDLAHYDSLSSQEFKDVMSALMEMVGKPNLADFFPVLQLVGQQGPQRQAEIYAEKLFGIFDRMVDQRLQARASSTVASLTSNDVLDILLDLSQKNDSEWSHHVIKHLFLDLFIAGTDTSSSTTEWAMAELIQNPEKMAKAQLELEEVFGKDGLVQEADISRLPYLQAIVKETLRLHPAAPLLNHKAEVDVEVEGFMVHKDTQILINVWAIGRDSSIWPNPDSFMPERFLDREIDFRGRDFELIPFGAGRRICPGLLYSHRMVHLILGSLLHSFDWKLEGEMKPEDMDMSDRFGITVHKDVPLKAIPIKKVK